MLSLELSLPLELAFSLFCEIGIKVNKMFDKTCFFAIGAVQKNAQIVDLENAEKCAYSRYRSCPYRRERAS